MKLLLVACLIVAKTAASAFEDYNPTHEDHSAASYFNKSTSSFVKIIKTADVRDRDVIYVNVATLFIGKETGEILRCLQAEPTECEVFYLAHSEVYALFITGEYIFAGLASGLIRCDLNSAGSCDTFHNSSSAILTMSVDDGYLYVSQYKPSTILRCDLNQPKSCRPFHTMEDSYMWAFSHYRKYIYAGQENGDIVRCSVRASNSCTKIYNTGSSIHAFANKGDSIFVVTSNGKLFDCARKSDATIDCLSVALNMGSLTDLAYFKGELYLSKLDGIRVCNSTTLNDTICSSPIHHKNVSSMAIAYETYQMQSRYKNEHTSCTWQSNYDCPPFVTYYGPHERPMLEVHVRNGRLYNSQGYLVDTRNAGDKGAAIFAMGPDGRILLTNLYLRGLVHTSSFFAGNPVAGAGEMVVVNGVIEYIASCSDHYRPDLNLNRQVVESLRSQGYTDLVDLRPCRETRETGENIGDEQTGAKNVQ